MNANCQEHKLNLRDLTLQLIWIATLVAIDMADLLVMLRETTTCVGTARSTVHFFFTASYLKAYYRFTTYNLYCTYYYCFAYPEGKSALNIFMYTIHTICTMKKKMIFVQLIIQLTWNN